MICPRCGAANDAGYRFCGNCGAQLPTSDATVISGGTAPVSGGAMPGAQVPPVPLPGPVPLPEPPAAGASMPAAGAPPVSGGLGPVGSGSGASPAVAAKRNRLPLIIAIAVAALIVVGALVAFLTYRNEVWGGKTLPDPASVASEVTDKNGKKSSVVKAKDVTEALNAKGLKAKTVPVFSGQDAGSFVGYAGVKQGERVKAGSTVTVQESAGPGVPKDTVGKDVNKVVDTFAGMGVPIHYKQIIVTDTKKTPEGTVMATYPNPGQGVAKDEMNDGIYVGVATKGDGLGADIIGQDKDEAAKTLESQGYGVKLEPHYSSKQYVGKISGSDPAPGTPLESGQSVTLYYGVDKSSNRQLLSVRDTRTTSAMLANMNAMPMAGQYCKSEVNDPDKDCVTLEDVGPLEGGDSARGLRYMRIKGHDFTDSADAMGLTNFSMDVGGQLLEPAINNPANELALKNHLLLKDWGMFEVYSGMGQPNCGDAVFGIHTIEFCINGEYKKATMGSDGPRLPNGVKGYTGPTGLTYEMKDFLVYFPVGSDVKALEQSGYFDKDALAAAKKQKAVDTSRPFIVLRDKSLYSKTSVPADYGHDANPFVPTNQSTNGYKNIMEPMKPAPSDDTVYYLVESTGDYDWSSLPDAQVKQPSTKKKSSGNESGGSASGASFKAVADTYRWENGDGSDYTEIVVKADGTFSRLLLFSWVSWWVGVVGCRGRRIGA